jgi:nucleotide-binding universal stress UspA family protein
MMHRILVGYDGSESGGHALDKAIELARLYNCPMTVLTAADQPYENSKGDVTAAADEGRARWLAEQGVERARLAGIAQVDSRIPIETPADALVHAAREGYDMVVVGHRGHRPIREFFLGSTAKDVVDRLECSVLVVR